MFVPGKQGDTGSPGTPGIPGLNGLTGRKVSILSVHVFLFLLASEI